MSDAGPSGPSGYIKVTVRLDDEGGLAAVDVEGDPDRDHLVAETPGKAPPLPDNEAGSPSTIWPLG